MKSTYIQPKMIAVKLHNQSHLMEGTTVSGASTNLTGDETINYGGVIGDARVKESNIWDDEW